LFGNFQVFKKKIGQKRAISVWYDGKFFWGNFFRCPFQYPKVPLEAGAPPQSFDASYAPGQSGCNIPHHEASLFINGAAKHLFQCQQDSNTNPE
jgi:hypothetical protein